MYDWSVICNNRGIKGVSACSSNQSMSLTRNPRNSDSYIGKAVKFLVDDFNSGGYSKDIIGAGSKKIGEYMKGKKTDNRYKPYGIVPSRPRYGVPNPNSGSVPMDEDNSFHGGVTNQASYNTISKKNPKKKLYKKKKTSSVAKLAKKLNNLNIPKHKSFFGYFTSSVVAAANYQHWAAGMICAPDHLTALDLDVASEVVECIQPVAVGSRISANNIHLMYCQTELSFTQTAENIVSNVPTIVDIYFLKCIKDVPAFQALGLDQSSLDTTTPDALFGGKSDATALTIGGAVAITPYDIAKITQYWSIYRHEQFMSSQGSCLTLQVKFPINKTINVTKRLIDLEASYGGVKDITYAVLTCVRSADNTVGDGTKGLIKVASTNTLHYKPIIGKTPYSQIVSNI